MTIKHIFSDMDNTLLNSKGIVTPSNASLIKQAQIPFTLVSARAPFEMKAAIDILDLNQPQIAFNGGLVFTKYDDHYEYFVEKPLVDSLASNLIQVIREQFPEITLCVYDEKYWYTDKLDRGTRLEAELTGFEPEVVDLKANFSVQDAKVFKLMMIIFDEAELKQAQADLTESFGDQVVIQRSGDYWLEITSKEARKSSGIEYIMKMDHLQKEQVAAFGDGHNDIPMFESVGMPIAMANASAEIKRYAKEIAASNDEDGVGRWCEKAVKNVRGKR